MKLTLISRPWRTLLRSEGGQTLPVVALMLTGLLGMSGLALDGGNAYMTFRRLQAATDASALAGAAELATTGSVSTANQYSAQSGDYNATALANATMVTGYPKVLCLTTLQNQGMACSSPSNGNAVAVKQQIILSTYFMKILGVRNITLTASATAAMRGASPTPYNVAIVMDNTLSMMQWDSNCNNTQMGCALAGVQVLLQSLSPCPTNATTCSITSGVSSNTVDRVSLFVFPNLTVGTTAIDTACTSAIPAGYGLYVSTYGGYVNLPLSLGGVYASLPWGGVPTAAPYSFPSAAATSYNPTGSSTATYMVINGLSDYRTSDTASTLNSASTLAKAAGGVSGCGSLLTPNYAGEYGTYYAGALYAAQAALTAQKAANPGTQNVIILLSDGDANAAQYQNGLIVMPSPATNSGVYPSYVGECGQGVTAARAATAAGTRVYSVAYGSPQTGCSTDANAGAYPNISPCQAMADMASAPQYFFSDYQQSNSNSNCFSTAQSVTSLSQIFTQIAGDLTTGRLIPDNTP